MALSVSARRISSGQLPPNMSSRKTSAVHPSTPSSSNSPQHPRRASSSTTAVIKKVSVPYTSDPDEIFSQRSIAEVKAVLHKVRGDADAKQEELRLMVGERYRDLLQASTSIIEISQLSTNVQQLVSKMEVTTSLQGRSRLVNGTAVKSIDDDVQLQSLQCLAAHVKLLIDASEHLWRFLERKRYLHAAWLFLLCRAVHRSVVRADDDSVKSWANQGINVSEQFPLVQRQWDSLAQFRAQISHKATLSLRDQNSDISDVCGTILALHLLDSLPFMDGLDLLLKQRTRSLATLFGTQRDSSKLPSPIKTQGSKFTENENEVWSAILQTLEAISCSSGIVRHVLRDGSPPFLQQLVQFTQVEKYDSEPIPAELRISTSTLLASLPGGTVFASLPDDIKAYRPFIDTKSSSAHIDRGNVSSKLRSWLVDTCTRGKETFHAWLRKLSTIQEVWKISEGTQEWLSLDDRLDLDDKSYIQELFRDVYRTRVREVFLAKLENMSSGFTRRLNECIVAISEGAKDSNYDLGPSSFLLSAPPAPSFTQSGLGPIRAEASLKRFRLSIKHRIDSLTPLVESIISIIEAAAKSLRSDLETVVQNEEFFSTVREYYLSGAESTLSGIISELEHILNASIETDQLSKVVFCGRIAHIIAGSSLASELSCSDSFTETFKSRANDVYSTAMNRWASVVSSSAAQRFAVRGTVLKPQASSRPSPILADLLRTFSESVMNWGFSRDRKHRTCVAQTLLSEFSSKVTSDLQQVSRPTPLVIIWDLHFVRNLCGAWGEALAQTTKLINQRILELTTGDPPPPFLADVEETVSQSIAQMSLLLAPILPDLPSKTMKSPKSPTFRNSERRPGASKAREIVGDELPVLALAKPTSRFGSLWVSEQ